VQELSVVMHCPPQIAAQLADRRSGSDPVSPALHLRRVMRVEALERSRIAPLTGHFVAAVGIRR
jgi:hypothetical protein